MAKAMKRKAGKVGKAARKSAKKAVRKSKKVQPIPVQHQGATPYLTIKGAAAAIEFYKKAFGAKEVTRMEMPPGVVMHAELKVGAARFMLSDEFEQMGGKSPRTLGGSPVTMMLYVKNVDGFTATATAAGARIVHAVQDHFYGDRMGHLEDPYGHHWMVATHIEDVKPKELAKRAQALMQSGSGSGAPA
jgi:PhnB protein